MKKQSLTDRFKQVRIIPMMYLAGMHARDDLMGVEDSWRRVLEAMGFSVDCPMVPGKGKPVSWAYTSRIIRHKLAKQGNSWIHRPWPWPEWRMSSSPMWRCRACTPLPAQNTMT